MTVLDGGRVDVKVLAVCAVVACKAADVLGAKTLREQAAQICGRPRPLQLDDIMLFCPSRREIFGAQRCNSDTTLHTTCYVQIPGRSSA